MFYHFGILLFTAILMHPSLGQSAYYFTSDASFNKEDSLANPDQDVYTLKSDRNVILLLGYQKKDLLTSMELLPENSLKQELVEKSSQFDFLRQINDRKLHGFQTKQVGSQLQIYFEYSYQKQGQAWNEVNAYVLTKTDFALASIAFPESLSAKMKLSLRQGIKSLDIIKGESAKFEMNQRPILQADNKDFIFRMILSSAEAADQCNRDSYVLKGKFISSEPGSALFSLDKLARDIKAEARSATPNESKQNCLVNFYKQAIQNSANYWGARGIKEHCITPESKKMDESSPDCPDSTKNEMKKSLAYIDALNKNLKDFLATSPTDKGNQEACKKKNDLSDLAKFANTSQKAFCCDPGPESPGPFFKYLSSAKEGFAKLSESQKVQDCVAKVDKDERDSIEGTLECMASIAAPLKNALVGAWKAIASLFDAETYKAFSYFVLNITTEGPKLLHLMKAAITEYGENLAAGAFSVTECMNDYEKVQYTCKVVPEIIGLFLSPKIIGKFMEAIKDTKGAQKLASLLKEAAPNSPTLKAGQSIASAVAKPFKADGAIGSTRVGAAGIAAAGKMGRLLLYDISTPIWERVKKSAKAMFAKGEGAPVPSNNSSLKALTNATRVESATTDKKFEFKGRNSKTEITDLVEGEDGVFRDPKDIDATAKSKTPEIDGERLEPAQLTFSEKPTAPARAPAPAAVPEQASVPAQASAPKSVSSAKIRNSAKEEINKTQEAVKSLSKNRGKILSRNNPQELSESLDAIRVHRNQLETARSGIINRHALKQLDDAIDTAKNLEQSFSDRIEKITSKKSQASIVGKNLESNPNPPTSSKPKPGSSEAQPMDQATKGPQANESTFALKIGTPREEPEAPRRYRRDYSDKGFEDIVKKYSDKAKYGNNKEEVMRSHFRMAQQRRDLILLHSLIDEGKFSAKELNVIGPAIIHRVPDGTDFLLTTKTPISWIRARENTFGLGADLGRNELTAAAVANQKTIERVRASMPMIELVNKLDKPRAFSYDAELRLKSGDLSDIISITDGNKISIHLSTPEMLSDPKLFKNVLDTLETRVKSLPDGMNVPGVKQWLTPSELKLALAKQKYPIDPRLLSNGLGEIVEKSVKRGDLYHDKKLPGSDVAGYYHPATNTVNLNLTSAHDQLYSNLLHEIKHRTSSLSKGFEYEQRRLEFIDNPLAGGYSKFMRADEVEARFPQMAAELKFGKHKKALETLNDVTDMVTAQFKALLEAETILLKNGLPANSTIQTSTMGKIIFPPGITTDYALKLVNSRMDYFTFFAKTTHPKWTKRIQNEMAKSEAKNLGISTENKADFAK